jgi:hypothetical protein
MNPQDEKAKAKIFNAELNRWSIKPVAIKPTDWQDDGSGYYSYVIKNEKPFLVANLRLFEQTHADIGHTAKDGNSADWTANSSAQSFNVIDNVINNNLIVAVGSLLAINTAIGPDLRALNDAKCTIQIFSVDAPAGISIAYILEYNHRD